MGQMGGYSNNFFVREGEKSFTSARQVVPKVVELLRPRSVVDVGCGRGTWLSLFAEQGIDDILGVDGDYLSRSLLQISPEKFMAYDLRQPLVLGRQFDLAMSLEVAEHLPADVADTFIDSLCRLSPVVMFSAAIPFQGGVHHVNERWPDYWADLFDRREYAPVDCLRPLFWRDERVSAFYAQNLMLFVNMVHLETNSFLRQEYTGTRPEMLSVVHPRLYLTLSDPARASLLQSARRLASTVLAQLGRRGKVRKR